MAEYIWLQQLQSYSQLLSAASQRMTSQAGPVTDWLLHQQGLFALGMIFAAESCKHYPDHSQCCIEACGTVPACGAALVYMHTQT